MPAGTPRIDAREHHQRERIHNGVASGELTRPRDAPPRGRPGAPASRRSARQGRRRRDRARTCPSAARSEPAVAPHLSPEARRPGPQLIAEPRTRRARHRTGTCPFHIHGPGAAGLNPGRSPCRVSCAPHDATLRSGRTSSASRARWRGRRRAPRSSRSSPAVSSIRRACWRCRPNAARCQVAENPDATRRAQDRTVRRARAGHQPQQGARSAVPDRRRSRALRPSTCTPRRAGPFDRVRRDRDIMLRGPARHRPFASPRLRLRRPEPLRAHRRGRSRAGQPSSAATSCRRSPTCACTPPASRCAISTRCAVALGYERINLYGGSYGTRVAQHYARRYPQATRTLILDGVVNPELVLGPGDRHRCRARAGAHPEALHGRCILRQGLRRSVRGLPRAARAARREAGRATMVSDAATGRPIDFDFTTRHLSAVLRFASYNDDQAALLPLSLHLATHEEQLHAARQPVPRVRAFARGSLRLRHAQQRGLQRGRAVHRIREARSAPRSTPRTWAPSRCEQLIEACQDWPQGRGRRRSARAAQERRGGAAAVGRGRSGDTARIRRARAARRSPTAST